MKRTSRLLGAASAIALVALSATPALAAGTTAGTDVTNTVSVSYQVGGVSQTAETDSDTFTVDRKVNLTVAEVGSAATIVSPGETLAVTTFQVTNLSNDTIDVALTSAQQTGGAGAFGGTDNFDVTGATIYVDTNSNGVYDDGVDQAVTYLDELAADASQTVFVVSTIPAGLATDDVATVILTGQAEAGGSTGSEGAVLTSAATNTSGVDTVLADGNGGLTGDANYDGIYKAADDYKVLTAALTVVKSSKIVSDPVNGTTNPKAIPGAVIEYCIAVSNAAGGTTASNITVTDVVPSDLTFVSGSIKLDGTLTGSVCNADGTAGGTYTAGTLTVSGTLSDITAGSSGTLVFQATID
ncbi:MAG: hypothetical protein R3E18_12830 [Sphingomonadaceae bacterium]|nr:DUF11 domain-containing protein [Sphingomonadaceae bacterium]